MLLILFFFFLGIVWVVAGADSKNYFTNPASNTGINPVWTLGEQQVISWETTLGEFNISFWQQSLVQQSAASQGNVYAKIHKSDQVTNFTWVVQLYGFDLDYSNVFFFWINADRPEGFISSYFNITEPTSTRTDTATSISTTSDPTSTQSATDFPLSSPSPTSSPPVQSPESSGLGSTEKIAIGIGVGIGVPVLCALIAVVWLLVRQSERVAAAMTAHAPAGGMVYQHKTPWQVPQEVYGSAPSTYCGELPSGSVR